MKISRQRIEIAMARQKMSRKELAEKAAVSGTTIGTILRRGSCTPKTAGMLAEALGIDVTSLVE